MRTIEITKAMTADSRAEANSRQPDAIIFLSYLRMADWGANLTNAD